MAQGREIVTNQFEIDSKAYKERVTKDYKERILLRAQQLRKEAEEEKVEWWLFRKDWKRIGRGESWRGQHSRQRIYLIPLLLGGAISPVEGQGVWELRPHSLRPQQAQEILGGEILEQPQPQLQLNLSQPQQPQATPVGETLVDPLPPQQ